jgi:hypothetical protein
MNGPDSTMEAFSIEQVSIRSKGVLPILFRYPDIMTPLINLIQKGYKLTNLIIFLYFF